MIDKLIKFEQIIIRSQSLKMRMFAIKFASYLFPVIIKFKANNKK